MGTNYYARKNCCHACGRPGDELHIGKSSVGWRFHFHVFDEAWQDNDAPKIVDHWVAYLDRPDVKIVDEYGRDISVEEFWSLVDSKKEGKYEINNYAWIDDAGRYVSRGDWC